MPAEHLLVQRFAFEHRGGLYRVADIRAGRPEHRLVIPPAGHEHAFERDDYPVHVQVSVSPTGNRVQVHVDGKRGLRVFVNGDEVPR